MTTIADDNTPNKLLVEQGSTPSTPAAGKQRLFIRTSDHKLCRVDPSGTVTVIEGAASSGYAEGTSFPGSPATNEKYYRTDRNLLYYYDGTRWLTTQVFLIELHVMENSITWPPTVNTIPVHRATLPFGSDYDYYLLDWHWLSCVLTTNDGTKYWTADLHKFDGTSGDVSVVTANTSADTAGNNYAKKTAINALLGSYIGFYTRADKTSTPGAFRFHGGHITCRAVG